MTTKPESGSRKAVQRLIRSADGTLAIVYIDLKTLKPIPKNEVSSYNIINKSNPLEELVDSFDSPDQVKQIINRRTGEKQQSELYKSDPAPKAPEQKTREERVPFSFDDEKSVQTEKPAIGSENEPEPVRPTSGYNPTEPDPRVAVEAQDDLGLDGNPYGTRQSVRTPKGRGMMDLAPNGLVSQESVSGTDFLSARTDKPRSAISGMNADLRGRLQDMIENAPPDIQKGLGIMSGFRTPEHQASLKSAAVKAGRGHMVGSPKGSQHVKGNAADLSWNGGSFMRTAPKEVQNWVHENAPKFGLNFPMNDPKQSPYEPWHIETLEARTGIPQFGFASDVPKPAPRPEGPTIDQLGETKPNTVAKQTISAFANPVTDDVSKMSAAEMRNRGIGNFPARTQLEKNMIAHALAGEMLSGTIEGIAAGDPEAMAEYANMISTVENRAASTRFKSIRDVLKPSQFNSLMKGNLKTTNASFAKHKDTLLQGLDKFYSGELKPTNPTATNYYNASIASPSWGSKMKNPTDTGEHRFGALDSAYDNHPSDSFKSERDRMSESQRADPGRFTGKSDYSGGGYYSDDDTPSEKSGRGPGMTSNSYSQGSDSPSEGGSRFGGSGLGTPSTSTSGLGNYDPDNEKSDGGQRASDRSGGLW